MGWWSNALRRISENSFLRLNYRTSRRCPGRHSLRCRRVRTQWGCPIAPAQAPPRHLYMRGMIGWVISWFGGVRYRLQSIDNDWKTWVGGTVCGQAIQSEKCHLQCHNHIVITVVKIVIVIVILIILKMTIRILVMILILIYVLLAVSVSSGVLGRLSLF